MNDPFFVDECLSPDLAAYVHARGHHATHVNHRNMSGAQDHEVLRVVREGGFVLVTSNARDFLRLYAREPIHAGLVIIVPGELEAPEQLRLFGLVLDTVESLPELTSKVIEVFHDGDVRVRDWPTPA